MLLLSKTQILKRANQKSHSMNLPLLSTLKRDNEIKKLKVERKCAEIVALSWAYCNVYPVHTLDRKYGIMKLSIKIHLLIDSFIIPYFLWKSYSKPLVLK